MKIEPVENDLSADAPTCVFGLLAIVGLCALIIGAAVRIWEHFYN